MVQKTLRLTLLAAAFNFFENAQAQFKDLLDEANWEQTKEWVTENKDKITIEDAEKWLDKKKDTINEEDLNAWVEEVKDQEGYEWV